MGAIIGALFILGFGLVNMFLWGNDGYNIHLLSYPVDAYSLTWVWIGLISIICGANYAVGKGQKHPVWYYISIWWAANIGMTTILNAISPRAIESSEGLILDFLPQAGVDLIALGIIWMLAVKNRSTVSVWLLGFCGFLVANLFGHVAGAYNVMIGVEEAGQIYDSYMYLIFTVMLVIQALGSGGDALLRWSGSNVNLYRDIRPLFNSFANRHLHLS